MKKKYWKILLIIGLIPFAIALSGGIYNAITGTTLLGPELNYGFDAFLDWIVLFSYIWWPTYIIGIALIITSILKSKNAKIISWFKRCCIFLLILFLVVAFVYVANAIRYNLIYFKNN